MLRFTYFFIFALSGFSGLIYQSIWSHYLKLFLGHSAYAQILVLVIFMSGMAIGAWVASLMSGRLRNLLLAYAIVEGIIGLFALGFHNIFIISTDYAYDTVIPNLSNIDNVHLFKWGLAAILILPQSILLGMTFPFMSAGLIRRFSNIPGYALSTLYFTNSFGAAIGVLVSGFVLIGFVGLPGTVMSAGLINIVLALWVWLLCRSDKPLPNLIETLKSSQTTPASTGLLWAFLWVAALTGLASFIYEIAWIRMLSLVLGSSTHSFELMLSAFILGLALGSFWIRGRIDHFQQPLKVLGLIQIAMGFLALATIFIYGESFEWMVFILKGLQRTEEGYFLFHLSSHVIALLIMLPATFCAGMTLPLLTHYLVTRGHGEKSIGRIYAANTLGSIIGVVLAIQWIMPQWGLKNLLLIGGAIDIVLGVLLLIRASTTESRQTWYWAAIASVSGIALLIGGSFFYQLNQTKMASGVFRSGEIYRDDEVDIRYQRDGKTASVTTAVIDSTMFIRTNGKIDAGVQLIRDPEIGFQVYDDSPTMLLLGILPWATHPNAKDVAVIGMGSGMSSHTLLHFPNIERVDTIEIEPAIVEGAKFFGKYVEKVFNDPRSHIHIEDAKTYFTNNRSQYDIIVSEPSNPWVSGVAGLFSKEFYARVVQHIKPNGIFAQWIQIYEIDVELIVSILKALAPHFSDYAMYSAMGGDLIILAKPQGQLPQHFADVFAVPSIAKELNFVYIHNMSDLYVRKIAPKALIDKLIAAYPIAANSDYFPILDLEASRTQYLKNTANALFDLRTSSMPLWQVLLQEDPKQHWEKVSNDPFLSTITGAHITRAMRDYVYATQTGQFTQDFSQLPVDKLQLIQSFIQVQYQCQADLLLKLWLPKMHDVLRMVLSYLPPEDAEIFWEIIENAPCFAEFPPRIKQWLALYKAINRSELGKIPPLVHKLLIFSSGSAEPKQIVPFKTNEYLVTVGLLAYLATENYADALKLWQHYGNYKNLSLELRVVLAALEEKLYSAP